MRGSRIGSRCRSCGRCTCNTPICRRPTSTPTSTSSVRRCWSRRCSTPAATAPFICRPDAGWISSPARPTTFTAHYAVDQTPVFVREGSIIPGQPADMAWSDARPLDRLVLDVYGSGKGHFDLYEDDGVSLAYEKGRYAVTPMTYATARDGSHRLVIGPSKGSFDGQVRARSYELRIHGQRRPLAVSLDGRRLERWNWDARTATTTIVLPEQGVRGTISVGWQ